MVRAYLFWFSDDAMYHFGRHFQVCDILSCGYAPKRWRRSLSPRCDALPRTAVQTMLKHSCLSMKNDFTTVKFLLRRKCGRDVTSKDTLTSYFKIRVNNSNSNQWVISWVSSPRLLHVCICDECRHDVIRVRVHTFVWCLCLCFYVCYRWYSFEELIS